MFSISEFKLKNLQRLGWMTAIVAGVTCSPMSQAKTNILFIMDASNSMNGKIGEESKLAAAQNVLGDLLSDLPADTQIGLMAYGHTIGKDEPNACTDIHLISDFGADTKESLTAKINGLKAVGRTPIEGALTKGGSEMEKFAGENNQIVLISDGVESCDGDPCAAAGALASSGIQAKLHVVGFDISDEERKQLECISRLGNGRYFSAKNADELKTAVAEVKKAAVVAPKFIEHFRDDFDGAELGNHWQIVNPDPNSFIVEDGSLLMISSTQANLNSDVIPNLFLLDKQVPKGDWRATASLRVNFQTGREVFYMGVYRDKDAWLVGSIRSWADNSYGSSINVRADKFGAGAKETFFQKALMRVGCNVCSEERAWVNFSKQASKDALLLRMEKTGRSYTVSAKYDNPEAEWVVLEKLTMLRGIPTLAIGLYQDANVQGETLINVDSIVVEQLEAVE